MPLQFTPYFIVDFAGVSSYNDTAHSLTVVVKSYALLLAGGSAWGFFHALMVKRLLLICFV
jgi:hypothetical protein